jgi:hemerythrin-like domain-containing protein
MTTKPVGERRDFLTLTAAVGMGLILTGCRGESNSNSQEQTNRQATPRKDGGEEGGEVTATEDLMREHGILRRALLVYTAASSKLRNSPTAVPPGALQRAARLFRAFGEDYHEKTLEETYVFPAVKSAGGSSSAYPDILIAQHQRGREITDYILAVTQGGTLTGKADELARVLDSFVPMYRHHAAREDTIVFPAWKKTLSEDHLHELSEKFEEIEHQQFGEDGFDDAVRQISEIESSIGLADIAQFTAPAPPAR